MLHLEQRCSNRDLSGFTMIFLGGMRLEQPLRGSMFFFFFFNCMFYQLLRVLHSSSSTQSRGSVLPSIVEMRD